MTSIKPVILNDLSFFVYKRDFSVKNCLKWDRSQSGSETLAIGFWFFLFGVGKGASLRESGTFMFLSSCLSLGKN